MVKLTASDWQEIYYALDTKLHNIPGPLPLAGAWTKEEERKQRANDAANTKKWAAHLKSIMRKIGPDGLNMTKGVPIHV